MQLISLEISGFKSFGKKTTIKLDSAITSIVGPNGSGKSNVAEAIRFVLGEQSMKSMRGKQGSDLIFKGSSALAPLARTSVTAVFDNRSNRNTANVEGVFSYLQFDEVRISRELYADGSNEYLINDTKVRLKDVQELLSTVNIGTTGHHIISQGEADRILTASAHERKEMIEDALGLKLYQWRIRDAQKKLEKTDIHLREGEISRKEIAPHLHFLKRQVEKIEARREQAEELSRLYQVYLLREDKWIESEKSALFGG
jgi:chromosome segregation protein